MHKRSIDVTGKRDDSLMPGYLPLTREELISLLEEVRPFKRRRGLPGTSATISAIQCRLQQAIPGMTMIHPNEGPILRKLHKLDIVYMDWIDDLSSDEPITAESPVVVALMAIMTK